MTKHDPDRDKWQIREPTQLLSHLGIPAQPGDHTNAGLVRSCRGRLFQARGNRGKFGPRLFERDARLQSPEHLSHEAPR